MTDPASKSITWDPDTEGNTTKQISSSPRTVSALKLSTTGAGPATVFLYDSASGQQNNLVWVMDAPVGGPDFNTFDNPLCFYKGIFAVMVQGGGLKSILNVAITPAPANPNQV